MHLKRASWRLSLLLATSALMTATGCLSLELGTKPTQIQDNPETKAKITALENRVSALEKMLQPVESSGYTANP